MSNNMIPPPPPPPPPVQRGGGGGTPAFVRVNGGGGGGGIPPPPNIRPPGPPGPPGPPPPPNGFQLPIRQQINSTRISDITPRKLMDEDTCRKKLTTYDVYTVRKIPPRDSKDKATWAKAEVTKEPLSQEDIVKTVKRLNESKRTVQEKKAALMPFQQGQVNRLMDELMTGDNDINFAWSLAQLDSKTFTNKKGQKETSTITIYVKRAPLKDVNAIGLMHAIERNKQARLEQMNRPPPRPEPVGERMGGPDHHPIVSLNGNGRGGKPGGGLSRPKKKYHDHSSVSSEYSSDEDSSSEYSSEGNTTISTQSDRRSRRYSHKGRSRSRPREHRKKYYVSNRLLSPEPFEHRRESYAAQPRYVPEVPRVIQTVPAFDPVAAAYQAGKIDADAERYGVDRLPRRSIAEPAAIVSYGRPERVYSEPRYIDDVRYADEREEDYLRREDLIRREERRRQRDAEEYMDRRGGDVRLEPKIIYSNPFAPASLPRRYSYAPSHSTRDGW